jgi:hypothetical protein
MQLNGRGGHLEQTYLYLDRSSAAAWCSIAEHEIYTTARNADADSDRVAERFRGASRSGRARRDWTRLWRWQRRGSTDAATARAFISNQQSATVPARHQPAPLLVELTGTPPSCSGDRPSVSVYAQSRGTFHNLQRYTPLLHTQERAHRRRMVCMFGNTFANLQNEIMFVRNSLLGFAPGDFLLLNVPAAMALGR